MNARILFQAATALCIFTTGACGMTYEVVWQRYLARLLGSDAAATAVVLAAFLGGLSLGYHAFGRLASRLKRPWRALALAEAAIGLWGLAFPTVFALVEKASSGLSLAPPWLLAGQGFALAAVLTGPSAVCMGATVPLLTQALSRDLDSAGRVHALLYGVNTAGAFLGAVLAGYLMVPVLGLPASLFVAASLNFLAAAWFAATSPPAPAPVAPAMAPPPGLAVGRGLAAALMGLAFLNGFQAMALENVLVRFVALSVGASAYAFTMVVGVFVLAIAAGALAATRASGSPAKALWTNQVLIAALLLAVYPTLDTWPYWAHRLRLLFAPDEAGFWGFQAASFAALGLVAGPAAACIGAAVPLIFNRLRADLGAVGVLSGRILCVNTLGNLAGSLAAGLALHPLLNNGQIFLLCAVLAMAGAWIAAREMPAAARAASGLAALAGLALLPLAPLYAPERFTVGTFRIPMPLPYSHASPGEFYREFLAEAQALFQEDGPEGSAAVVRGPLLPWSPHAPLAIFVNGKSDSSTVSDTATLKLLAHLPALLAPKREQVLVVGLGTGVTSAEFALYGDVARIATAEISSSVIKALPLFAAFTGNAHLEPRMDIVHGDALRILARSEALWDIIVSEPSNPWVLGVDALFSREFYHLAGQRLAPGGLFVQWIHIHDASPLVLGSVLSTLGTEFKSLRVFMSQANDLVLLASDKPIGDDALKGAAGVLATNPAVAGSLGQAGFSSLEALLAREIAPPPLAGPVQSLDHPVLHYLAGRSFFKGERVPAQSLLAGEDRDGSFETLLERRARLWPFTGRPEALSVIGSAVDRRGEEPVPLPLVPALKRRLDRPVPP